MTDFHVWLDIMGFLAIVDGILFGGVLFVLIAFLSKKITERK